MAKSKAPEDLRGAKPRDNLIEAMEYINRIIKYADENGHTPEVVKILVKTICDQHGIEVENPQIQTILGAHAKYRALASKNQGTGKVEEPKINDKE